MLRFDATQRQKIAEVDGFKRAARKADKAARPKSEKRHRGRERDNGHLAFIRRLPCACGCLRSPCDAAHVRYADLTRDKPYTAKGVKPSDKWTVPLFRECHQEQHGGSERTFWDGRGIDPLALAERLYAVSGDTEAGARIVRAGRTDTLGGTEGEARRAPRFETDQ